MSNAFVPGSSKKEDVHEKLARMMPMEEKKVLYSVEHGLAKKSKPEIEAKCQGCGIMILGEALSACDGKYWHPKCFKCNECACDLSPESFMEADGWPFCKKCIVDREKTAAHNRKVASSQVPASSRTVKTGMDEQSAAEMQENLRKGKEACATCGVPFKASEFDLIEFNNQAFHSACFKCCECHKPIGEGGFADRGGKPACAACVKAGRGAGGGAAASGAGADSNTCAACQKALTGTCVSAQGAKYHQACFKCGGCAAPISGGFSLVNRIPHCSTCAKKKASISQTIPMEGPRQGLRVNPVTGKTIKQGH